jgi:hypothetical protein
MGLPARLAGPGLVLALGLLAGCDPHTTIDLGDGHVSRIDTSGTVRITTRGDGGAGHEATLAPDGTVTLDGVALALDGGQRERVLAYLAARGGIAEAGAEIGAEGARLAADALRETAAGLAAGGVSGAGERVRQRAEGVRAAAARLCARLPALEASRDALVAAVPELAPFAASDGTEVECDPGTPETAAAGGTGHGYG